MGTHNAHAAAHPGAHHDAHGHHDDHHGDEGPHSSMREYVIGFLLSVVLTAIPFWLVMADVITDRSTAVLVLGAFAVVQIVVHMVYFLHMNGKVEGGWTMLSTIFTVVFVVIAIAGTLWVMFHMNTNMMPMHGAQDAPAMQGTHGTHGTHDAGHTP
jgi:cytochrome o ubiquinol oxidase subunit IV